ncbi:hypothetical protein [Ensifer sp. BR816]|uniref:hypothetical protein n=1 Tax=Rhizobium sp. (strain BR816) TaxID=1057002 RepID=UPI000376FEBC|nr:hypothetical protein [Ensifer sp. BR816]
MRILLILLSVYHGANGILMLVAPELWFHTVPDVDQIGPFNAHFVRDIGLGFVAAASVLAVAAWRGGRGTVLWSATIFLAGHAGLHLIEMAQHGIALSAALRDGLLIVVPGLMPLVLSVTGARQEVRA